MIFKKSKSNHKRMEARIFHDKNNKTNKIKFKAMFIGCFGYTFWLWRNEQVYLDWPNSPKAH